MTASPETLAPTVNRELLEEEPLTTLDSMIHQVEQEQDNKMVSAGDIVSMLQNYCIDNRMRFQDMPGELHGYYRTLAHAYAKNSTSFRGKEVRTAAGALHLLSEAKREVELTVMSTPERMNA